MEINLSPLRNSSEALIDSHGLSNEVSLCEIQNDLLALICMGGRAFSMSLGYYTLSNGSLLLLYPEDEIGINEVSVEVASVDDGSAAFLREFERLLTRAAAMKARGKMFPTPYQAVRCHAEGIRSILNSRGMANPRVTGDALLESSKPFDELIILADFPDGAGIEVYSAAEEIAALCNVETWVFDALGEQGRRVIQSATDIASL